MKCIYYIHPFFTKYRRFRFLTIYFRDFFQNFIVKIGKIFFFLNFSWKNRENVSWNFSEFLGVHRILNDFFLAAEFQFFLHNKKFPFQFLKENLSDSLGVEIVNLHNCVCHRLRIGDPSLHWFHGKIPESHPTEIRWKFLWPFLINCVFNRRIENWGDFRPIKEKLCCWSVFSGL